MANPPAMPWVKLHTSLLDDSRFARLDDVQKFRYCQLLMLAGKLDAGGFFFEHGKELSEDEIAWKLRIEVERLTVDLKALSGVGLTHKNGHGWALPEFLSEQGPTQADKRAAWKARQNKHRHASVTGDTPVTHAPRLKNKNQESDPEKKDASASSSPTQRTDNADDVVLKIFKASGAYKKHMELLKTAPAIKPEDCWAMLAWKFSQDKIREPGVIMAMNLLDGQRAPANWYDESCWGVIPPEIRKAGGLVLQSDEKQVDQSSIVATRISSNAKKVLKKVDKFLGKSEETR